MTHNEPDHFPDARKMVDLAARIERAEGPDRALDAEIAAAADWRAPDWELGDLTPAWAVEKHGLEWLVDRVNNSSNSVWRFLPAFTGSIDAAMQLVPEGWSVGIGHLPGASWKIRAHLRDHRPQSLTKEGWSHIWVEGHHSTFACSLAAAAIRARSAS